MPFRSAKPGRFSWKTAAFCYTADVRTPAVHTSALTSSIQGRLHLVGYAYRPVDSDSDPGSRRHTGTRCQRLRCCSPRFGHCARNSYQSPCFHTFRNGRGNAESSSPVYSLTHRRVPLADRRRDPHFAPNSRNLPNSAADTHCPPNLYTHPNSDDSTHQVVDADSNGNPDSTPKTHSDRDSDAKGKADPNSNEQTASSAQRRADADQIKSSDWTPRQRQG